MMPVTLKEVKVQATYEQNDPPSSLVADAEQYRAHARAYAAVSKDFTGQQASHWVGAEKDAEIGDGSC